MSEVEQQSAAETTSKAPEPKGGYFTIKQVAEEFGYSRHWILKLVQQGRIKGGKPTGTSYRIPASEVERMRIEGLARPPRPEPAVESTPIHVQDEHMARVTAKPAEKKEPEPDEEDAPWPFNFLFKGKGESK